MAAPAAASAAVNTAVLGSLQQRADAVLAAHRQMIVLMNGERSLKPAERRAVARPCATIVGPAD
ncbi:MAG: hypothetical protein H7Z15_17490 [Rhizobacter sp.]|nr:hypothetical protein [Rhizobacter sp.]